MPTDYNATINLPKTDFAMRANLSKREPDLLCAMNEKRIYETLMEKNEGLPLFVLHDGPPFSNGDIHVGHAKNKLLKDFIVRYKNMSGYKAPYTPGWDNHGMPIESAIIKKNKLDRKKMSIPEFRSKCRDFALNFVDRQREQFKRLGIIGDWDNPYLTLDPKFEAEEIRVFGKMYEKGYIYKGLKPVYWCPTDETALAEAEIEYEDAPCTAIFVKFKLTSDNGVLNGEIDNTYFVIWTTTTWTLPGNLAICLGSDIDYSVIQSGGERYIMASSLAESVLSKAGITQYESLKTLKGRDFELMTAQHPFYDRQSLIIIGEHVTTEAGTGCVHTAPGFGVDDFNVCAKYPQLPMVVPVDARGIMTSEALQYEGLHYSKASDVILEDLRKSGALLSSEEIVHSYPHCWRCKKPIIFRAAEQWFASVDAMKDAAVEAARGVKWIPEWGEERMISMLRERTDWCISRQRHWGLPIPVFYCENCGKPVCTNSTIESVASAFSRDGSNTWFELEARELLPDGFVCPHCGDDGFIKGSDSLDCWFDSGSTHAGVLEKFPSLTFPADLYLEGGDQYRGWFQSSMLTSIAVRGIAPYRRVITHGWTVDGEGKAMHKSLGNTIAPEEIVKEYGADLLRLWVASTDYRVDGRISREILKQLSDIYLKIRNTARYILGNLKGFDPANALTPDTMLPLDCWALSRLNALITSVTDSYERFEFHTIYHKIHNFCAVDMSSIYLDIIKDRLYCDAADSISRRSAQTAIYYVLDSLVKMLAPILAFTTEEIWSSMPHLPCDDTRSVLYNVMPRSVPAVEIDAPLWEYLLSLREDMNKALEIAREQKTIGKPLEAVVTLSAGGAEYERLSGLDLELLRTLFIVSDVRICKLTAGEDVTVEVERSVAEKCARCWVHSDETGQDPRYSDLCPRCAKVVSSL